MQDFTTSIKNSVRQAVLPLLQANAPIKSGDLKTQILNSLGYTRDQFGYTQSGGSKIENLISSEIFSLKQKGVISQEGNLLTLTETGISSITTNIDEQVLMVVGGGDENQDDQDETEESNQVVNIADLVNPALSNKLLACDGYRNSLIENTPCFGMFDKTQCHGCMLAFWCSPFTGEKKAEKKAERQAKKQVKTAKEVLLEKYADKKETLENLLSLINHAVKIPNNSTNQIKCFFDAQTIINPQEDCMFVKNFGVVCMKVFNELKDAGLVK